MTSIQSPTAEAQELLLDRIKTLYSSYLNDNSVSPLPPAGRIEESLDSIIKTLPEQGIGLESTVNTLLNDIVPAVANQSKNHYYGFVTGGVTPAALVADNVVSLLDQNVGAYLPKESISTIIESISLRMLLDLLQLDCNIFKGRTITTGATASNVSALLCAREWLISQHLPKDHGNYSVSEVGLYASQKKAQIEQIQVISCLSHSSLGKAAAIAGLGRQSIVSASDRHEPWKFDFAQLEKALQTPHTASIVAVSMGEVNTGRYTEDLPRIRKLCDKYNAWMHVDGAFGIYSRVLIGTDSNFEADARRWTSGLELADSITGDAHKTLNVPYDCGYFFTRNANILPQIFHNPGAAYLATDADDSAEIIPSPFEVGIENSRRFRSLPLYSTLIAYGKKGYEKFVDLSIKYSRDIAAWIDDSPDYTLLPVSENRDISTIILFRANNHDLNRNLKNALNSRGKIYASGSLWDGQPAVRIAVSNWKIVEGDPLVINELKEVARLHNLIK